MALSKISCMVYLLILLSMIVVASANGYGNSKVVTQKIKEKEFMPRVFSVQGIIYCKSGNKVFPLKGGVVRIACLGIDKEGYETAPFSILTRPTDGNGYFLAKLSSKPLEEDGCKIFQCKAFLHSSSSVQTCQVATDANRGLTGAPLSAFRILGSGDMRLYSVGPFVYSSGSAPTGY